MDKDYVRIYLDKFKNSHKGLESLNIKVRSDYKDAFPQLSEKEISNLNLKGGYYPASNTVLIIASKHKDINDLNKTIKHEVFGHHALNRLSKTDKLDLLETIATAPKNSEIGQIRDNLQENGYQHFKSKPLMLAEEVFAHIAEQSYKTIDIYISTPDPKQIQSKNDILDIVDALKNGIHHGVLKQQIYPINNNEQFKVIKKDTTMKKEQNKAEDKSYTIRQAKIIEIPKDQIKSYETSFSSRKEAVTYKVCIGSTHTFSKEDKQVLSENFKEITSKAYKNYPAEMKESKSLTLKKILSSLKQKNNEIQKDSPQLLSKAEKMREKVKAFCNSRDEKQKSSKKSLSTKNQIQSSL